MTRPRNTNEAEVSLRLNGKEGRKRRHMHLTVDVEMHRLFKERCKLEGVDMARACEALWMLFVEGRVSITASSAVQLRVLPRTN